MTARRKGKKWYWTNLQGRVIIANTTCNSKRTREPWKSSLFWTYLIVRNSVKFHTTGSPCIVRSAPSLPSNRNQTFGITCAQEIAPDCILRFTQNRDMFHGPAYGSAADVQDKREQQYDYDLEIDLQAWMESKLGHEFPPAESFQKVLRDGVLLCNLLNNLAPNSCKPPKIPKPGQLGNFVMMENINNFLVGLDTLGFHTVDKFVTVDLYEGRNMLQVLQCLDCLRIKFA